MPASRTFLSQSFQSFGDISRFLREGVADEDSRQLRDSLGALSNAIEEAVRIRRTSTDTQLIHRTATALFQGVREHQRLLTGLGAYSDENRHQFQSNVGHYFQRKPCHLFRLNHSQSFHSKVGH